MVKKILSTIAFVGVFCVIFALANNPALWITHLWLNQEMMEPYSVYVDEFYKRKNRDKYDVVFIGSSHAACAFYPKVLWEHFGIPSYVFSSLGQELYATEYFLKETLKVQQPTVVVVEVVGATMGRGFRMKQNNESSFQTSYPLSPFSFDKIKTLFFSNQQVSLSERFLPLFPLIKYHENWKILNKSDFAPLNYEKYRYNHGAVLFDKSTAHPTPEKYVTPEKLELDSLSNKSLNNIINICEQNDIELVFVAAPFPIESDLQKILNRVGTIADSKGVSFVDYNRLYQQASIDFSSDFADIDHLNIYGMEKLSMHFGEYLSQNYDLPDRRGEEGFEDFKLAGQKEYIH